jgi:phosphoribosylanthranilate isomerase
LLRLKVAGISSLTDARYCAGMGVEMLSFRVSPENQASLTAQNFKAIAPWIEGVSWLGEFEGTDADFFREAVKSYDCNNWLLHAELAVETERPVNISRFCKIHRADDSLPDGNLQLNLEDFSPETQKLILEKAFHQQREIMLSNFYQPLDAIALAEFFPQLVFSIESGLEERPGWMDLSDLQDYLEKLDEFS